MANTKILVINLGSTSTKIAAYNMAEELWSAYITHDLKELSGSSIMDQYDVRLARIMEELKKQQSTISDFRLLVSAAPTIRPVEGGIYRISDAMIKDADSGKFDRHACSIGGMIAYRLGEQYGIDAITADPPNTNQMLPEAKYSGLPHFERMGRFQALNHRAISRRFCRDNNLKYEEARLVVAHLGGGITVAGHWFGKVVDVNNGLAGDGSFTPERAGGLPTGDLIKMCYSGKYTENEILRLINGNGGLKAYLGETDGRVIQKRIDEGDEKAAEVVSAMAYQVSKEIGAMSTVFSGQVDAILLTGGLANWDELVAMIIGRVKFIAPIHIYAGENEMQALAEAGARYIAGEEMAKEY